MTETKFHLNGRYLHMIDVGGQKSERRKWINAFADIDAILFLVSLNGYDQCMFEDRHAVRVRCRYFSVTVLSWLYFFLPESNAGCHGSLGFDM